MSKKVSIIIVTIIVIVSLAISIYIPNKERLLNEKIDTSKNYETIEENGKVGVKDGENIIIEPQYDKIIIPNEHREVFMCENGEEAKFVNSKNETIFQEYDDVELIEYANAKYERNILRYEKNGKYGLLSLTGKTITDAKYEDLTSLTNKEGEVLVKENGEYGIIDEKGNTKIKNKYDSIQSDGFYTDENGYKKAGYIVSVITNDGYRYGYYDSDGVQVLNEDYNQITRLTQIKSDTYLIVAQNGQYGVFINNSKIINTQYQSIDYNSDLQVFIVERTKQYGAINLKGVEIIPTEYKELKINGIYLYGSKDDEQKVFDTNGKIVNIPFNEYINSTSTLKYFIKSQDGKYTVVNSNFEDLTKQNYHFLEYAYDNYFIATNEQDKVGVIDTEENIVVEFEYDVIQLVKGKSIFQAIDFETNKTDIYDNKFDLALEMSNANIEILDDGVKVKNNEQEILLDNNGKVITK